MILIAIICGILIASTVWLTVYHFKHKINKA
jgi:formate/nitrite transporter FocA (FNT family)